MFGAWTNLTDLKAGNTLDTLVDENGRASSGTTCRTSARRSAWRNGPHDWDKGWEYFYDRAPTRRRLLSFGFALSPWQTVHYTSTRRSAASKATRSIRAPGSRRRPTTAYIEMRADDAFWAARRVMAFSDDLIRARGAHRPVQRPAAERHLADVLIKRRDEIGRAYLTGGQSDRRPALDASGELTFDNAAVAAGFAGAAGGLSGRRGRVRQRDRRDDAASATTREQHDARCAAPRELPSAPGNFVEIDISAESAAHPAWQQPVRMHFRRDDGGWKLVGLERLPDRPRRRIAVAARPRHGDRRRATDKGWLERLLSPIADVRRGEVASALLMTLMMFLILGGYYLLKTAREVFILSEGGAEVKSYSSAGQALLLLVLVPAYGAFASRVNRVQLVQWVTLFFVVQPRCCSSLRCAPGLHIGIAYFLWVGIFNVMVIAQFWAFANDLYTPEQGKRLFPLIGVGSSLGAWVGSVRAGSSSSSVGPTRLLVGGAVVAGRLRRCWRAGRSTASRDAIAGAVRAAPTRSSAAARAASR